jgi:hypothetical protein
MTELERIEQAIIAIVRFYETEPQRAMIKELVELMDHELVRAKWEKGERGDR